MNKATATHGPRGFECLCGNARMAARALTSIYDQALQPAGLRAPQLAVLWAVVALPGRTVKSLAGTIAMDATTLTRNLRLLERDSLIELVEGTDRREREVHATARGRRAFAKAMPLWEAAQKQVERIAGREARELNRVLLALSRSARQ
ncbi:MAG TPA: MarR family winged helix-turn-helix transcriptional regulator [Burkholderiaceae bacterium]|nr:MarR family winged helix-turn-helix transcriptional regulator [Burkholderiaceae bacterium]